jgi:hypothetical protein
LGADLTARHLAEFSCRVLIAYLGDTFDDLAEISTYAEAVHRLTDVGAVVTHVGSGTSREGFDAEWRLINMVTLDGDLISRSETFDEADLDAAVARFDELSPPLPEDDPSRPRAADAP